MLSQSMLSLGQTQVLRDFLWLSRQGVRFPICENCSSSSAVHDLAALSEGNLSTTGKQRLAEHLSRCPACHVVLASLLDDPPDGAPSGEASWLDELSGSRTHGIHLDRIRNRAVRSRSRACPP
jgi:hypothetical protein